MENVAVGQCAPFSNLVELLRARCSEHGPRVAFRFLEEGETEASRCTYGELEERARAIAASLASQGAAGERALLYYPAGLDFIAAFWGCVFAGVVAVPVFPARLHRQLPRLLAIAADSEAKFVLSTAKSCGQCEELFKRAPALRELKWIATDALPANLAAQWHDPAATPETLAFLQYTSGSTAAPRGVMVTHGNLLHNLECLRDVFEFSAESVGVTWLPHFHDMGLIGGLLQPLYAGGEMIVMSPSSFLQRPVRWLAAASRYRATTLVAPNFAYELCAEKISPAERETLDLSSVNVALCGAEPVRPETLSAFSDSFGAAGFRREAFRPAYGLAEATLLVSGRASGAPSVRSFHAEALRSHRLQAADADAEGSRALMRCGSVAPGLRVVIVDPKTLAPCAADRVGEIWVCGPSVASGYWRKPDATKETFGGYLASGEGPFLRTGDLGFLDDGQLVIAGRAKDLIIIRGSNHYPQDLEYTVERSHRSLRPSAGAAFSIEEGGAERLVIVQEVNDAASVPGEDAVAAIRRALTESHEVHPYAIALIEPRGIPRTSSGKIQRYACREAFLSGGLKIVYEWRDREALAGSKESGDAASHPRSGLVWDYLSTQAYSHRLAGSAGIHATPSTANSGENASRSAARLEPSGAPEPIAIVGIGCRFPGASGLEEFWTLLRDGVDAISETPRERWDIQRLYDPLPGTLAKLSTRWGGFLAGVDQFDPHFFGISPREAAAMDPQQRVLLEVVWEALENAGQAPDKLAGTRTGVFVGIGGFDYTNVILNYKDHLKTINAYLGTGNAHSIAANRISYLLDLRGPSLSVDTACSSSLVAIHMACESLRSGESSVAISGAVNLILSPEVTIAFSHARMMAADGRCKTFDAKADGYVRSEGAGAVILKRLSDAVRDRDRILALVRGSAVNQDGRTAGIAAPNASAQQAVIREALEQARVSPGEITYVEAHGTGTSIGDPIEVEAVKAVLGAARNGDGESPCVMGSVKANIGHAENASGMAGLAKVLGCLEHNEIPGQIHFSKLNPRISLDGTRLAVARSLQSWPEAPRRLAGISSFGFGGTNAHLVVEEAPPPQRSETAPRRPLHVLALSARTERALQALAGRYAKHLAANPDESLADLCFTANSGRSHFARRIAIEAESSAQLREALEAFSAGEAAGPSILQPPAGHMARRDGPRVAYLFTGDGSNAGIARELYESSPAFRAAIDECSRAVRSNLPEVLFAPPQAGATDAAIRGAANFALEYALAALWRSWGVEADAVVSGGAGEFAAAVAAGVMSCEDALRLLARRAALLETASENGDFERSLDAFEQFAAKLKFEAPRVPFVSAETGRFLAPGEIPDAAYWRRSVKRDCRMDEAMQSLLSQGYDHVLAAGSLDPLLAGRSQDDTKRITCLASLDPDGRGSAWQSLLSALGALYVRGAAVDWQSFDEPYQPRKIALPTYPFERERCWEEEYSEPGAKEAAKPAHPLLGERVSSALPMPQFQSSVALETLRYLGDHRVQGSAVFPAAAFLEMARAAAAELFPSGSPVLSNITFQEALLLPAAGSRALQFVASPAAGGSASFQIYSSSAHLNGSGAGNSAWTLHASGDLRAEITDLARCTEEQFSLAEIEERCLVRKTSAELYAALKQAGLEYGPSFQGVRDVWCGESEALGEVSLPEAATSAAGAAMNAARNGASAAVIHPALLDSCLHLLAAALPSDRAPAGRNWTYLPVGVATARFLAQPGEKVFSHCVVRPDSGLGADFIEADLRLLDKDGCVAVELLGFRVRLVSGRAEPSARINPTKLLYDVQWIARKTPAAVASTNGAASSWLIVAGAGSRREAEALAAHLQSSGRNCAVKRPEDVADKMGAELGHVVYLAAGASAGGNNGSASIGDAEAGSIDALRLAQTLLRSTAGTKRRLWIVTRGAQAVGAAPAGVAAFDAPLWGLAKSLDLEHPELGCTRIDLDPRGGSEEIAALAEELAQPPAEREVAFRKGTRYVARLVQRSDKLSSSPLIKYPDAETYHLDISKPGNLDNLILRGGRRAAPRSGEVEIRVSAAGLNFRDVMNAAGVYPGGPIPFGAECAGTVTAVGEGVTEFRVGDEVMALASGGMGSHVTADARAVVPKPAAFSFAQAATVPIAFLTAYYSLHQLARLAKGERVLIHAAAGGVGLAAVQLAQQAGAEVFATAGSPEKRAYLKSLRVPHIFDSRSLAFGDEILQKTGGYGVDVVLNSLPGEYITRSLSILAAYGRFVEIGKTDIYQNKPLGLFPFRNNLSYFALDLERVCRERPELVRSMLFELLGKFERRALKPLPHSVFRIEDAGNAFRYMARRKNTGKVVLSFRDISAETRATRTIEPRADATYLVTGGHGGLGLAVARWLVEKGARNIALVSRSGGSAAAGELAMDLAAKGARVETFRADVSSEAELARALKEIRRAMPPVRGVIHAAGVLDDRLLLHQDAASFHRAFAPKALGAWNLHTLTRGLPLDFFVMFSSVASVLGSPGQSNYAAANAFLDALAHERRAHGLPGLSINWGPWAEVGMAARAAAGRALPSARVMHPLPPADALALLERLLETNGPAQVAAMSVDWSQMARTVNGQPPALFGDLLREKAKQAAGPRLSSQELLAAPADRRHALLLGHVQKSLAQVMALEGAELDPEESMSNLGLDSLMALELQHSIEESFGTKLPIDLLMGMPTLNEFVSRLLEILVKPSAAPAASALDGAVGLEPGASTAPPAVEA